ncbi:uncharacterized membrane protein HdeD (DUF308 family) [Arthrobacter pigmenti]|uniref:Uncharacterized membrane protein HdeD (DUF308 family) n=1 Tax=Arthrobacter pigmenti TaxID=271432 RepID=A0A846RU85_9MICC|nr:DUF308 domain-containing protein [Arthrobacter pigmenti]NJC24104.1 uncharacterized membrane protein HdeD (DUF308 family) [Arthrobacter pigmenti]
MNAGFPGTAASPALWRAFLLRAAVAGAFGLLTIFWGQPSVHVLSVAGGLYFLATAATVFLQERSLRAQDAAPSWLTGTAPVLLAVAGLLNLWIHTDAMFAGTGALVLIVSGVVDVVVGMRNRGKHAAARDFLLVGVVSVLTGALLPLFQPLGAHALLGVSGGGAVITAVLLALAALSYRHDARQAADPGTRGNPVN